MKKEWLRERITAKEAESKFPRLAKRGAGRSLGETYETATWLEMTANPQPGDELWTFSSPPETWAHKMGRSGIGLVRSGDVVKHIILLVN